MVDCMGKYCSEYINNCICAYTVALYCLSQFIHSLLILFCLWVLCFVRPYKKYHINVTEGLMIMALFATTLSIYDRDDLHVGKKVGIVAVSFPFAYGGGFIIYRCTKKLLSKLW